MSCQATSFAKAASPVGAPLISGNPNTWNIGAGNHYSHLTNPFLPDPEPTRSAIRQLGGKRKKTRKHKKSKRHNIKRGKSKRRKNNRRKSKRRKPKTNKRMRRKRRVTRRKRGGIPSFMQASNLKKAAGCDKLPFSQRMACKAAAHTTSTAVGVGIGASKALGSAATTLAKSAYQTHVSGHQEKIAQMDIARKQGMSKATSMFTSAKDKLGM